MMDINLSPLNFQFHQNVTATITTDNKTTHDFFKTEYYYHLQESTSEVGTHSLLISQEKKDFPHLDLDFSRKQPLVGYTYHTHKVLAQWSYKLNIS